MKNYAGPTEIMYHTGLSAGMIRGAKYALLPGDPGRVEGLAKALDENALFVASHRDYTTWLARVENAPVLVMSTGMGGPCVTFAVEELARLGVETFIRVGTTGSIQEDLHLGDVVSIRHRSAWTALPVHTPPSNFRQQLTWILSLRSAKRQRNQASLSKRGFPSAPTASGRDRNGMTASAAMY